MVRCRPHTAEQICLKARSCVYHSPTSCSQKHLGASGVVFSLFFPQLFAVCICTYMTSTCLCQVARFIDLNKTVLQAIRACRWCKIQSLNSHYILSGMNSQPLSPPVVWPSPVFPHFLIFSLHLSFFCLCSPLSSPCFSSSSPTPILPRPQSYS